MKKLIMDELNINDIINHVDLNEVLYGVDTPSEPEPEPTIPIINLNGNYMNFIEIGGTYTELGAIWTDDIDGSGNANISGTVDVNTEGAYEIIYSYVNSLGTAADTVTRSVAITPVDTPVITLNGDETVYVELGGTYTELGATGTDGIESGPASPMTNVDTSVLGLQKIGYFWMNSSNEPTVMVRRVIIVPVGTISSIPYGSSLFSSNNLLTNGTLKVSQALPAGGYIYMFMFSDLNDYSILKLEPYTDYVLGIPFSNEDYFSTPDVGFGFKKFHMDTNTVEITDINISVVDMSTLLDNFIYDEVNKMIYYEFKTSGGNVNFQGKSPNRFEMYPITDGGMPAGLCLESDYNNGIAVPYLGFSGTDIAIIPSVTPDVVEKMIVAEYNGESILDLVNLIGLDYFNNDYIVLSISKVELDTKRYIYLKQIPMG